MKLGKNQYLITPEPVCVDFDRYLTMEDWHLYLGEGCQYTLLQEPDHQVLLIGYAVDASDPGASTEQLCRRLLDGAARPEQAFSCTFGWGGRWLALVRTRDSQLIWSDACGLRQLFFCRDADDRVWMASQGRYLAELQKLEEDPLAVEYLRRAKDADREYAWPLAASAYRGLERLLPNHWLDAGKGIAARIPDAFQTEIPEDPAEGVWGILTGCTEAVLNRGPGAVSITAGLDSRLALAAARNHPGQICAYTLRYSGMPSEHPDLTIARELCKTAEISHDTILCDGASDAFREEYMAHGDDPHPYWMEMACSWQHYARNGLMQIRGSCNEIGTNPSGVMPNRFVTVRLLCRRFGIPDTVFSRRILKKWLDEARPLCDGQGMSVLDLFYWEHRCGSWLAQCLNEQDVAGECFTPFNVRSYLCILTSIPQRKRLPPEYPFFREILDRKAACLRQIPINPGRYSTLGSRLKLLVKYRVLR